MTSAEIDARISELAGMVYRVIVADDMLRDEKVTEVERLTRRMLDLDARRPVVGDAS